MTNLLSIAALGAQIGFSLVLGDAHGGKATVSATDMASFSVVTNGTAIVATWHGHPVAGDGFIATVHLREADGAWQWDFEYAGQTSPYDVESVSFPEVTLARTDETRILYPPALGPGRLFRPDWPNAKPCEQVQESRLGVPSFQFTALFTPGARPF